MCSYLLEKNTLPLSLEELFGSRIGLQGTNTYGCVGFLVKSNVDSTVPVTGFLTTAHRVIKEYEELYDANCMLSEYKQKQKLSSPETEIPIDFLINCKTLSSVRPSVCEHFIFFTFSSSKNGPNLTKLGKKHHYEKGILNCLFFFFFFLLGFSFHNICTYVT